MTEYEFDGLPIGGVRPGTTVLLAGPSHVGTQELGYRLLAGPDGEGAIVVTTDRQADHVAEECDRAGITIAPDRTAILDCVGESNQNVPARVLPVPGPSDLTGIGMRFSDVYGEFRRSGIDRVRTGFFSLSTLLTIGDLQAVSRFVHTLVGRIDSVGGLGICLIDPSMHEEQTVSTLSQFCGGRIDVREGENGPELKARGLSGGSCEWHSFEPALDLVE
jgi:KaiC/GvpD/RAD55 family RecA-like ATPase